MLYGISGHLGTSKNGHHTAHLAIKELNVIGQHTSTFIPNY